MKWWRTRVTLPAGPACKAGLGPCPFPSSWCPGSFCRVGNGAIFGADRGQNRGAPLPTRQVCNRRFCPPYEVTFGAQGRFRAHLSAASAQRFHQISFLGEIGADAGNRTRTSGVALQRSAIELRPHGGCGTDSNLHSTEAPGYSRPGFPIPYTPERAIGCRSASRTRRRTAYETARAPGLPAIETCWRRTEVSIPTLGACPGKVETGFPIRTCAKDQCASFSRRARPPGRLVLRLAVAGRFERPTSGFGRQCSSFR
jgi:hypothetical protein